MLMLFSGCLYLYAARMAMPITVTVISGQTGWNKTTAGVVLCCFFWGYALTQVLGGYLGDLWGGAKVMLGSALGWSLLTLYTPEATRWNLATLLVVRILLGAFQGLHFPAMSSIIVNHLRPEERTFFTSVVAAGPSCGTSTPETQSNAMESIQVDGESISPEDITEEASWLTSHRRRGARALAQLGLTPGHSHGQEGAGSRPTNRQSRAKKQTSRQPRLPHQPPLPKEDIKTVLRP
ncbi:hypothetical protein HPB47_015700 [Ixodes persulcatus]|uniref:Uncharacterized protein n=1 Tax=Ixodes persulcatus TaxID=34615 RepID=A0AC60QUS0_IXOPE|nr:hypothetical protein HPB47_015700 [Ixodes persulcatus]